MCPSEVPEPKSLPFTNKSSRTKRVLWNLTKNQYVREEAIEVAALESTECKCNRAEPVGFGQVVLSHICLSVEYYSPHHTYSGNHHKGPWASNRFDISTVEMVEFKGSQWVDVSDEVSVEMNRIWHSKYGQQWVGRYAMFSVDGWIFHLHPGPTQEIGQVIAVAKNQEESTIRVLAT
jgi:hypothetical protein